MKNLKEMTGEDKAKLLFSLLPNEMPKVLDFIVQSAEAVLALNEEPAKWPPYLSFEWWQSLAGVTLNTIQAKRQFFTSAKVCAEQLFRVGANPFVAHCLMEYSQRPEASRNYKSAIELLFDYYKPEEVVNLN